MKSLFFAVVLCIFSVVLFSGCLKDQKQQPCNYDPCAYKAPESEIVKVKAYLDSNGITATQHCSGLFYKINNPGTGNTPIVCNYVNASYKGMLTNGHVFDSSNTGIDFNLSRVIRGWTNGVPLIKEGGSITLYIPPSLGYGPDINGDIPANSILIFDVGLNKAY
jgi:FKBP-type peptidyl-prolyl cis-trans isomerase FkpA